MPLTETAIRNAKPKDKPYKISDEKGLYLLVNGAGKYFRYNYRYGGKRKTLALGVYPKVTLKEAREKRDNARKLLDKSIDPIEHGRTAKAMSAITKVNSFEAVAIEWFNGRKDAWAKRHSSVVIRRLEIDVFPWLGSRPITSITAPEVLVVLRRMQERGVIASAHRVKRICGQVFRYAIATGRAERDPTYDLRGALPSAKPGQMATITDPKKIGELLRAIDGYQGRHVTRCALRLAPLVFVRPGELRHSEWIEVNLEEAMWKIPAEKMKKNSPHMVPLSKQAIAVLADIQPLTGGGKYIFPSVHSPQKPMSGNTILSALRRLDYANDEMSGHGFRAMASTLLHEQGWPTDIIERQLAHAERNSVKAAYNHAQHLPERRKMMQAWADYLDGLRVVT